MLSPLIHPKDPEPVYMQLRHYIVEEIKEQRLEHGEKLPSVRGLSDHLHLSRTTIENAYNQLLAEGYIESRDRRGYFVAYDASSVLQIAPQEKDSQIAKEPQDQSIQYDLASEYVSPDTFDYRLWKRHLNYIINYEMDQLYAYGDTKGEMALRSIIKEHFYRSRGVMTEEGSIIIGGGVSPLMGILIHLLEAYGIEGIGIENPGFGKAQSVFSTSNMRVEPLEVGGSGIELDGLEKQDLRACYVSPSHHFPTGYVMPVSKRQQLLSWAEMVDGFIIEDDYNYELRYEGRPIPAMQSMDQQGRVVYLGSFSTVLAPSIRVSFMVLPKALIELFNRHESLFSQTASKLEQLALAHLIKTGDFDRHIKRIRKIYASKQQQVLQAIKEKNVHGYPLTYQKGGLQLLMAIAPKEEEQVIEAARQKGIKVYGLEHFRFAPAKEGVSSLVINFRGIEEEAIEPAIWELMEILN